MRLYTYLFNGEERVGAERGGYIYPTEFGSMLDAIRSISLIPPFRGARAARPLQFPLRQNRLRFYQPQPVSLPYILMR